MAVRNTYWAADERRSTPIRKAVWCAAESVTGAVQAAIRFAGHTPTALSRHEHESNWQSRYSSRSVIGGSTCDARSAGPQVANLSAPLVTVSAGERKTIVVPALKIEPE